MSAPTLEPLGDQALLLRWGDRADRAVNRRVHALAAALCEARLPWLIDCVPAYASLAIFFDAAKLFGKDPFALVANFLSTLVENPRLPSAAAEPRLVDIPVCYGGDYGPDLDEVASLCGLSATQLVEKHARPEYLVAMLGFSPGFPYLLGLDPELAIPRLATPRLRVAAGSVAIGGAQSGVYPNEGPGGWRVIGRTPLRLFDAQRDPPAQLLPGDRVRFLPIDAAQFQSLCEGKT